MNTATTGSRSTNIVSTFLSHSSADNELVEAVAESLGRRGVLTWLDKNELLEMGPLDIILKQAVQQQATLTIFLSEASLKSEWCKDELRWAIEAQEGTQHILPVYLGDPLQLVKSHDLLRTRFLDADESRVNQLGYACQQNPTSPDPNAIAEKIAATAYRRSIPSSWSDVVIVLDQRGNGPRRGEPDLPDNVARLNAPVLTFRPNSGLRQAREVLTGSEWEDMVNTMINALAYALGTIRGDIRKVRVLGNAQTSLVWAIGRHFDRTTTAELYGYGKRGESVNNKSQIQTSHTSLKEGNSNRAQLVGNNSEVLRNNQIEVALGIGTQEKFALAIQEAVPNLPLFWIESGFITESEQAMQLVADIVASIECLRRDYGVREVALFWTTANHIALLAGANLESHLPVKIKFMEWDHARAEYVHLPMPSL